MVIYQPPDVQRARQQYDAPGRTICLHSSLRTSATASLLFEAAWSSMQSHDESRANVGHSHLWVLDFPAVHSRSTALHSAFGAVALARVGQENHDAALLQQSHVAYAKALSLFKQRLYTPVVASDDETLACIMFLALFEVMHGSGTQRLPAMRIHLDAAEKLVEHRGPSHYANPRARAMLRDMLRTAVWESVFNRAKPLLSSRLWTGQIWHQASKTQEEELLLIIASFSDAFHAFDHFKSLDACERTIDGLLDVHSLYTAFLDQVSATRGTTAGANGSFSYTSSTFLDPVVDASLLEMVPRTRDYGDMAIARADMAAASAQLVLHLELLQLCQFAATSSVLDEMQQKQIGFDKALCDPIYLLSAARHDCGVVIETFEQFLRPPAGVLGLGTIAFPVIASTAFLTSIGDPRVAYFLAIAKRYQERSGFPFADLIQDAIGHEKRSSRFG